MTECGKIKFTKLNNVLISSQKNKSLQRVNKILKAKLEILDVIFNAKETSMTMRVEKKGFKGQRVTASDRARIQYKETCHCMQKEAY